MIGRNKKDYYYLSLRKSIIKRKAQYRAAQCASRAQNDEQLQNTWNIMHEYFMVLYDVFVAFMRLNNNTE